VASLRACVVAASRAPLDRTTPYQPVHGDRCTWPGVQASRRVRGGVGLDLQRATPPNSQRVYGTHARGSAVQYLATACAHAGLANSGRHTSTRLRMGSGGYLAVVCQVSTCVVSTRFLSLLTAVHVAHLSHVVSGSWT